MSRVLTLIIDSFTLTDVMECLSAELDVRIIRRSDGSVDYQVQNSAGEAGALEYVTIGEMLPREDVLEDYKGNDELSEEFRRSLSNHFFFSVTYNNDSLRNLVLKSLITCALKYSRDVWVDMGYGEVRNWRDVLELGAPPSIGR